MTGFMPLAARLRRSTLAGLVLLALACSSSHAAKSEGEQQGRSGKQKHAHKPMAEVAQGAYFSEQHRTFVRGYYGSRHKAGKCPPGLAKKNNGCLPPGQARKWALGQPVPAAVVLYPVPQAVLIKLGPPPQGHRYVRVANDLLLIAIGTQMVVDAVEDLMAL